MADQSVPENFGVEVGLEKTLNGDSEQLQEALQSLTRQDNDDHPSLEAITRFAISVGQAALRYGSVGKRVQDFLTPLLNEYGYEVTFRVLNTEMFASISERDQQLQYLSPLPEAWHCINIVCLWT